MKAKKHIPLYSSRFFNRNQYTWLLTTITIVCAVILVVFYHNFGLEDHSFGTRIRFLSFFEANNTVFARLEVYVNSSKECTVKAIYGNRTSKERFKFIKKIQRIALPLPNMPEGKTRVEFFLNCTDLKE